MIRQTRIFIPRMTPFDMTNWAETAFGRIIRPAVQRSSDLEWYWFSRYNCPATMDSGDCDITKIPEVYRDPQNDCYRSVRFRYSCLDSQCSAFEGHCQELIDQNNCRISDFRHYDVTADLGSDRHLGGTRSPNRRAQRADIVVRLYSAISKLALDALAEGDPEGRFSFEQNDSTEIPLPSSFETLHHIFCNITEVPLRVLVSQGGIGTDYAPPTNAVHAVRVRF